MRFTVLALDYDGTIARDGKLHPEVRRAVGEVRATGVTVVLVTGRMLSDLRKLVGDLRFVDAIVAENGAVVAYPDSGQSFVLGEPVSRDLMNEIRARAVPIETGESVIEADASHAAQILAAIQKLELPQILAFNRGRLMVLPSGVNKASGLREVMRTLRLSPHNAIAIGDAENDHDLLEICELGVAVAWGSEALKQRADEILPGSGPEAVASFIREFVKQPRLAPARVGRRRVLLGEDSTGEPVSLAIRGRNVLVVGDPKSGKSWVAGLLCEQLILQRYSICVIDPEGDYAGLEALPGVVVLGGRLNGPTPRELRTALRYPDVNVILDLSQMPHAAKWAYIRGLLPGLSELRSELGVPHRIVLDEAHYVLNDAGAVDLIDSHLAGYTLVTYQPSRLHPQILAASEAIIVTRLTDSRERDALAPTCPGSEACKTALADLELGQAAILPQVEEAHGVLCRIQLAPRLTPHIRHQHKYFDIPVAGDRAFIFSRNGRPNGLRACNLREFIAGVALTSVKDIGSHLQRGDFSRWIAQVFGDDVLAKELQAIEEQWRIGLTADVNGAIISAVEKRYKLPEDALLLPLEKPNLTKSA